MIIQKYRAETLLVIIINVLPLIGLFVLDMRPIDVSLLYITETLIGFFFFEIKIFSKTFKGIFNNIFQAIFVIPHFVIFSFMHVMLSCLFFETRNNQIYFLEAFEIVSGSIERNIQWIIPILLYHGKDFFYYVKNKNFWKDESRNISKNAGYLGKRLLLMQFTVIIGGIIGMITNSTTIGISVLILCQIFINLTHYFSLIKKTLGAPKSLNTAR